MFGFQLQNPQLLHQAIGFSSLSGMFRAAFLLCFYRRSGWLRYLWASLTPTLCRLASSQTCWFQKWYRPWFSATQTSVSVTVYPPFHSLSCGDLWEQCGTASSWSHSFRGPSFASYTRRHKCLHSVPPESLRRFEVEICLLVPYWDCLTDIFIAGLHLYSSSRVWSAVWPMTLHQGHCLRFPPRRRLGLRRRVRRLFGYVWIDPL